MDNLYSDYLIIIFELCNVNDLLILQQVSKNYNNIINTNDYLWKLSANNKWHKHFFDMAQRRTKSISVPLTSYKKEIMRIIKYTNTRWTIDDFYNYWYIREQSIKNKKGRFPI